MTTIHSFIISETTQVLHFLLTLGVIAILIILCVQVSSRLRFAQRENMQLKREIDELQNYSDRTMRGVRASLADQANLLSQIGEHLGGGDVLNLDAFDSPGDRPRILPSGEVRIDLDGLLPVSDRQEPLVDADVAGMQSVPVQPEVDPSFPIRSEISNIADGTRFLQPQGCVDDSIDEDPDPLTRAIKISRAARR